MQGGHMKFSTLLAPYYFKHWQIVYSMFITRVATMMKPIEDIFGSYSIQSLAYVFSSSSFVVAPILRRKALTLDHIGSIADNVG